MTDTGWLAGLDCLEQEGCGNANSCDRDCDRCVNLEAEMFNHARELIDIAQERGPYTDAYINSLHDPNMELMRANDKFRTLLSDTGYGFVSTGDDSRGYWVCRGCGGRSDNSHFKETPHTPDCELAKALK